MSFDAVTWAKAQRMPFKSKQVCARAKAVLKSFASYVDARGRGWVAVDVLVIETDLDKRTVQRALADLKAVGLVEETTDTEIFRGKVYPIYRLPLEQGPQNTRDRLREDRGAGMTPVSPQENSGDTHVIPRGDTEDQLGVTRVSPKQEPNLDNIQEANTRAGREALFERLEAGFPKRGLCFTHRDGAQAEFGRLLDHGVDPEKLIQAAAGWAADPKGKKSEIGLQYWLKDGRYRGTWPEAQLALEGGHVRSPGAPPAGAAPAPDQSLWDQAMAEMTVQMGETEFGAYLRPAFLGLHEGALHVVALTATARQRIAERRWRQVQAAWAKADPKGRPLTLVSKGQFEALLRQSEGVG